MSLILDALKRADQERTEPGDTVSVPPSNTLYEKKTLPVKRWLVEVVVIVIAAIAWFYYPANKSENEVTVAQTPLPNETPVNTTTPAEQPTVQPLEKAAQPTTEPQIGKPAPRSKEIESLYNKQMQVSSTSPKRSQTKTSTKNPATTEKKASSSTTEAETVEPEVQPATLAAPIDPELEIFNKMPLLAQMPSRFQQSIPSIEYSLHVYSESAGGGFVMLNGKARKVGDGIVPGLIVIKILKDSVVLDYYGTQFRLLSLKSWVNFDQ